MVRCTNSSREPDGSTKAYWLRVDPSCRSAHEALASTWSLSTEDYVPGKES